MPHKSRAGWAHHHQSIRGGRSELYPVCSLGSCTLGIFRILIGTSILSTLQFPGGSRTQKKLPCRVSRRSCPKGEAGRRPTTTHLNPIARFIIKVYPTHQTDLSPDPIPRVELHRPRHRPYHRELCLGLGRAQRHRRFHACPRSSHITTLTGDHPHPRVCTYVICERSCRLLSLTGFDAADKEGLLRGLGKNFMRDTERERCPVKCY